MKQTAVDWLAEQFDNIVELYPSEWEKINNAINQAKAMEKNQVAEAWDDGFEEMPYKNGEDYYNKTFKSE